GEYVKRKQLPRERLWTFMAAYDVKPCQCGMGSVDVPVFDEIADVHIRKKTHEVVISHHRVGKVHDIVGDFSRFRVSTTANLNFSPKCEKLPGNTGDRLADERNEPYWTYRVADILWLHQKVGGQGAAGIGNHPRYPIDP